MADSPTTKWRGANNVTDWEFAEIGVLLCDNDPRDLALMVVRLTGQLTLCKQLVDGTLSFRRL
jgi:hypothetical protein